MASIRMILSTWQDSQCAPFIWSILNEPNRDDTRLVWADWLDERGDEDHAYLLRNPIGYWHPLIDRYWCSADINGKLKNIWVDSHRWCWLYPSPDWLDSERCENLLRGWLKAGIHIHYDWAHKLIAEMGYARYRKGDFYYGIIL